MIVHHLKYLAVHVILAVDHKTCKVIFWSDTYVSPIRYIYNGKESNSSYIVGALIPRNGNVRGKVCGILYLRTYFKARSNVGF